MPFKNQNWELSENQTKMAAQVLSVSPKKYRPFQSDLTSDLSGPS